MEDRALAVTLPLKKEHTIFNEPPEEGNTGAKVRIPLEKNISSSHDATNVSDKQSGQAGESHNNANRTTQGEEEKKPKNQGSEEGMLEESKKNRLEVEFSANSVSLASSAPQMEVERQGLSPEASGEHDD